MAKPEAPSVPRQGSKRHGSTVTGHAKRVKSDAKAPAAPAPSKPLTSKERREALRERKSKVKKNFDLILAVTAQWEELRRHDISPERRSELVTSILGKTKGRLAELAASHTASRIVQSCAKHGSPKERDMIFQELKPSLQVLAKSPYGRFVLMKLISTASKQQIKEFHRALKGRIPELARHPAAAHVLDELYSAADTETKNAMVAEFYGREYRVFDGGELNNLRGAPSSLPQLLGRADAVKAQSIVRELTLCLLPVLEKKLVDCALVHRVAAELLAAAPATTVADAVASLSGDPLLHMAHTREGARACCMTLAYGAARDRKRAVRALKGHVLDMARDEWAHLPLLTCLGVVDDTSLLRKFVIPELQASVAELVPHATGRRVLLELLNPGQNRYVPPLARGIMDPSPKIYNPRKEDGSGEAATHEHSGEECTHTTDERHEQDESKSKKQGNDDDEDADSTPRLAPGPLGASKKDPILRRTEILSGGLGSVVCSLCAQEAGVWLRSQNGADVVVEIASGGRDGVLESAVGGPGPVDAVHAAIVSEAALPRVKAGDNAGPTQEHLLESFYGSRALRRLLQRAQEDYPAARRFAHALWDGALKGRCGEWVDNHGAKVVVATLESAADEVEAEIESELEKLVPKGDVGAWVQQFHPKLERNSKQKKDVDTN